MILEWPMNFGSIEGATGENFSVPSIPRWRSPLPSTFPLRGAGPKKSVECVNIQNLGFEFNIHINRFVYVSAHLDIFKNNSRTWSN